MLAVLSTGCRAIRSPGGSLPDHLPGATGTASPFEPSHDRNWSPDLAILPYADIEEDRVRVHHIRNCTYRSDDEFIVKHYDKVFDLDKIEEVDFWVVPFKGAPGLAHTLLSFGFRGGDYVAVSVEARLEKGESYSPISGALGQFELMYVVADERDVIVRRTKYRGADVYLYRTRATPEQARRMFLDVMERVNKIYREPEFYDTVSNNCTTNIVDHLNRLKSQPVSLYDPRVLLPGYADRLAYEIGLLDSSKSFDELRSEAHINARANEFADRKNFSELIRR